MHWGEEEFLLRVRNVPGDRQGGCLPAIVDAHHHLWSLSSVTYPWLMAKGQRRFFGDPAAIQKDYLPADFLDDHAGAAVEASVHVQVGAAPGQELAETSWLDGQAGQTGFPTAIVAFADVSSPRILEALAAQVETSSKVRGIRQIVSRHTAEDGAEEGAALLASPAFLSGLRQLARLGLSFDLQLTPPLLQQAAEVFGKVEELPVALCHVGSPWDQSPEGLRSWRKGLAAFAALPRSAVKLSGFGMFDPHWTGASLKPLVEAALEAFGPTRTMWGSNFPVDKLYRSYRDVLAAVMSLVPEAQREDVFNGTARRFYRLPKEP
jgi:predicted TIM-barrel fold metal-dependent hydrolase